MPTLWLKKATATLLKTQEKSERQNIYQSTFTIVEMVANACNPRRLEQSQNDLRVKDKPVLHNDWPLRRQDQIP